MLASCISCGGPLARIERAYHYGKGAFRDMCPGLAFHKCVACGLKQVDHDSVDGDMLRRYYADAYRQAGNGKNRVDLANVKFVARGRAFAELAVRQVPSPESVHSVFELGAGLGYNLIALRRVFPCANFYTDEPDSTVELPKGIAYSGLEPNSYDVILMSHVLEHILHPAELCVRISAALRPGGTLIVEVPNDADRFIDAKSEDQPHLIFFEMETLRSFFQRRFPELEVSYLSTSGRTAVGCEDKESSGQPHVARPSLRKRVLKAFPALAILYAPIRHFRIHQAIVEETAQLLQEAHDGSRAQLRLVAKKRG